MMLINLSYYISRYQGYSDFFCFTVPHANMYIVVNPVRLAVDYLTLVWLNAFSLNLLHSLVSGNKGESKFR